MRLTMVLLLGTTLTGSPAAQTGPIQEWPVPWDKSRPRDPAVAPDGRIWFVGQAGNYVARLDPASGKFEQFSIDSGTHPHNVVIDAAGNAWYAGNMNGMIGKIDGGTGVISRYPMPDSTARDPHTLTFDGRGDLWFTVQNSNFVGKLVTSSGKITLIPMVTPRSRPYGIVIDRGNRPWFVLFGTNKVGTIDPATMALREYPLPNPQTRPRRIALTSDGMIWYGDYTRGALGRLDPRTGATREWPLPSGRISLPYAMTTDDEDRIWTVETGIQPNRLVAFDPRTERFLAPHSIPSGGGTIRHMVFDPKSRMIWFGTDVGTIGRADAGKLGKPTA